MNSVTRDRKTVFIGDDDADVWVLSSLIYNHSARDGDSRITKIPMKISGKEEDKLLQLLQNFADGVEEANELIIFSFGDGNERVQRALDNVRENMLRQPGGDGRCAELAGKIIVFLMHGKIINLRGTKAICHFFFESEKMVGDHVVQLKNPQKSAGTSSSSSCSSSEKTSKVLQYIASKELWRHVLRICELR